MATGGALAITVQARNGGIEGSDPAALRLLRDGGLEFMTLMGGILGQAVPVMEIQGLPFAFRDHADVFRMMDGPFGQHLARECMAAGIHLFAEAGFENGFRHITSARAPVTCAADLEGVTMRVPDGEMFRDLFDTLGARPVVINIAELHAGLAAGRAEAAENALVVNEVNRLYEVQRYLSLTGHMWSGFNLIGSLTFWRALPEAMRRLVEQQARFAALAQRGYTAALNARLEDGLVARGMLRNVADAESFRRPLGGGFYPRWRARLGASAWDALLAETGALRA